MKFSESEIRKKGQEDEKLNKDLVKFLKKKTPGNLDEFVQKAHDRAFKKINCLDCGNCCKSLGPRITDKDIERISKYLRIKSSLFIDTYLRIDEDRDFVFKKMPCAFLEADNLCSIYEHRPKACREYPHTDRRKFSQLLDLTLKNSYVCPAVNEVLGELRVWKEKNG